MEIALGLIAILVSLVTLWWTSVQDRRNTRLSVEQAELQKRLAAIEEARRRDELRPKLRLSHVPEPGDDGMLEWVNDGPVDLDDVSFRILDRSGAGWKPLRGVRFPREGLTVDDGTLGPMAIGEAICHPYVREPGSEMDGGTARFRMTCTSGDLAPWDIPLECVIPPQ